MSNAARRARAGEAPRRHIENCVCDVCASCARCLVRATAVDMSGDAQQYDFLCDQLYVVLEKKSPRTGGAAITMADCD